MIAALAALVLAAEPLTCPAGLERRGQAPTDGYEQWCEGKDAYGRTRREGPARSWYDDGGVWIDRTYKAGELDGPFLERHRNGKPAREGTYAAGNKAGTWRIWSEAGVLEEESQWRDGSTHGAFTAYYPSGVRRTEGRYCGGAQCGRWRTFDPSGKPLGEVDYGEQRLEP